MTPLDFGLSLFVTPIALAVTLVYLYGLLSRAVPNPTLRSVTVGGLLGAASVYALHNPFELTPGYIIDLRNLFIGIAAGMFGFVAGALALAIGAFTRLSIGGAGALYGFAGVILAALSAYGWRRFWPTRTQYTATGLAALGVMMSAHLLSILPAPAEIRNAFLLNAAPQLMVANVAGALLVGKLLSRERRLIEKEEKLAFAAATDPLTQLLNRRGAEATFARRLQSGAQASGWALAYFDLDHFKSVNDGHGHAVGDAVLLEVSKRVQSALRPGDIFARIGGDEFLVALPTKTQMDAVAILERCREQVAERPFVLGDLALNMTISIGLHWQTKPTSFEGILNDADDALYQAKKNGRNRVALSSAAPPRPPMAKSHSKQTASSHPRRVCG